MEGVKTRWRATGQVIGSTRFGNYVAARRRVQSGWTWLAPAWQHTGANTEATLLMLGHTFETSGSSRLPHSTSGHARNAPAWKQPKRESSDSK